MTRKQGINQLRTALGLLRDSPTSHYVVQLRLAALTLLSKLEEW